MTLESSNLTKNQQTVLNVLEKSSEPLKAYTILYDIQKKGIKSPLQVYRALDKLIEIGKKEQKLSLDFFKLLRKSLSKGTSSIGEEDNLILNMK